ncbi:MAG: hypothetical protein KJ559_00715 [Nanoarchaeota archaeon]|nr:hypothetical protein [Nanoarchaeota archaeon]
MKKIFAVSLMTFVLSILTLIAVSSAGTLNVTVNEVYADGIQIGNSLGALGNVISAEAGETIPVRVYFTAEENANEVEVSAWIQGHKSDTAEKNFYDLVEFQDYNARLSLKLPSDVDPSEELTLYIRMEADTGNWEEAYTIGMQRQPHKVDILFAEFDYKVSSGALVPVDVVLKNLGRHELDDLIVSVSIPELSIKKSAYFGDLIPLDDCDDDCDKEDAVENRIYIRIPSNAQAGIYDLKVEAYNSDSKGSLTKSIMVIGTEQESNVVAPVISKEIGLGNTVTYNLVIVNPGNKIGVYEITVETTEGVFVKAKESMVTIQAGSSKIVELDVKGLKEGSHNFLVDVKSGEQLINRVTLNAVVTEKAFVGSGAVLTIVLVIVFLVLLAVLIVLVTKKPESTEELEESYY